MQHEQYLLKMDDGIGDKSNSESLTHHDKLEEDEDDLEFCTTTTIHLPIPVMQSHLMMILDNRPIKDLTMMMIQEFDKNHTLFSPPRSTSSMPFPLIRHPFSDIDLR